MKTTTADRIAADLADRDARSVAGAAAPVADRIAADNAARAPHPTTTAPASHADETPRDYIMLRNGYAYLTLRDITRADAEALAQRTTDASRRMGMGRRVRFTIA